MNRPNILETIVSRTREDISRRKRSVSERELASSAAYERTRRGFRSALTETMGISVIAEIKKASPSKGIIRQNFRPSEIADTYERNGASALSVLTDEPFFKGSLQHLQDISERTGLPVLRKDFIIDPYQVVEARAWGADAILLIVRILSDSQLLELHDAATEKGLDVLVECYDRHDLDRLNPKVMSIVGVNNRDLETFEVDIQHGISLLRDLPEGIIRVSESGIREPDDLLRLQRNGIHAVLIGEHFMRAADPGVELSRLTRVSKNLTNVKT
ncbi:MAG: indole-3-glycerol phosphate synthase TrpC [Cyclonatronaceae bacterium]